MTDCQKLNVKLLLTRAEAGSIIGIKGGNISKLRGETNVCLHISKDKTEQRILSIRGNQENAYAALENILDTIDERNTGLRKRPLKLLLEDKLCKELVCRNAQTLKEISKQTGVRIAVTPVCMPSSSERVIKLEEGRGEIIEGVKAIYKALHNVTLPSNPIPYNPPCVKDLNQISSDNFEFIWPNDISSIFVLGSKLGVKISSGGPNLWKAEGPAGGVDMLKSIVQEKRKDCDTMISEKRYITNQEKLPCMKKET